MDSATVDELRALRARAFGPDADIDKDPAAMRRLHELESANGRPASGAATGLPQSATSKLVDEPESGRGLPPLLQLPTPLASESRPQADAAQRESPAGEHGEPSPDEVRARESRATRARLPLRTRLMWAASVVATAALATGATYSLTAVIPVSVSSGAKQIATLEPVSTAAVPAGWLGTGPSSMAYEFYGLALFETGSGTFGVVGTDCFMVIAAELLPEPDADPNSGSINGPIYTGCRVGDFPATVQLPINSNAPKELRDRYPDGSALQFVRVGDKIGVFLDA